MTMLGAALFVAVKALHMTVPKTLLFVAVKALSATQKILAALALFVKEKVHPVKVNAGPLKMKIAFAFPPPSNIIADVT